MKINKLLWSTAGLATGFTVSYVALKAYGEAQTEYEKRHSPFASAVTGNPDDPRTMRENARLIKRREQALKEIPYYIM